MLDTLAVPMTPAFLMGPVAKGLFGPRPTSPGSPGRQLAEIVNDRPCPGPYHAPLPDRWKSQGLTIAISNPDIVIGSPMRCANQRDSGNYRPTEQWYLRTHGLDQPIGGDMALGIQKLRTMHLYFAYKAQEAALFHLAGGEPQCSPPGTTEVTTPRTRPSYRTSA